MKLVTQSSNGCTDSISKLLTVLPSPIAEFSINDSSQCFNENRFLFNFSKVPNFGKVVWYLGDSNISTDTSINHSYKSPGIYPVQMIIENQQGCKDTAIKTVTVLPSPITDFSINDSVQCLNEQNFIISDLSTIIGDSINKWYWRADTSLTAPFDSAQGGYPIIDELQPAIWNLILITQSSNSCTDSISKPITVLPSPVSNFSINDSSQCFNQNKFDFTNTSSIKSGSIDQYDWDMGNEEIRSDTHITNYSYHISDTTLYVKLTTISNDGCIHSDSSKIYIRPMPQADFFINNPSQCLKGNNFNFSNLSSISSGFMDFKWFINDSLGCTNQQFNNITIQQYGNYNIKILVYSNYNCMDSMQETIFIHPMPKATFTYSIPCLESEILFSDKSSISRGNISNWKWYFSLTDSSTLQNPSFVFNNPGNHFIRLLTTSDSGCTDTGIETITIYDYAPAVELERVTVVNDNYNLLEWKASTSPIISTYKIEKSYDFGNFNKLKSYPADSTSLIDYLVIPDQSIYTYHIFAVDSCAHISEESNIARTILLEADSSEEFTMLAWSAYEDWKQGIQRYEVQVFNDQMNIWNELESFILPLSITDSITKLTQSEYCYRIAAFRNNDELQSHSNVVCVETKMNLFIPNAFSPNGDDLNEIFLPKGIFVSEYNLQIFNRWGEKVFESDDINEGWDGSFKGNKSQLDSYYYYITAKGANGKTEVKSGTVHLLK